MSEPNILFILTDDQTYNAVGALGNPDVRTPNMDRLVQAGTAFTNAHILGASITAVCAPSRAMIMTGRHYFHLPRSVQAAWTVPESGRGVCPYITFPEVFREKGYTTFATGKQHNGKKIFVRGFTDGGNLFFKGMHNMKSGGHLRPEINDFEPSGEYPPPRFAEKFSTELFTDAAVEFLEHYRREEPFLMYVAYTAPHDPRMAPEKFLNMYPPETISLPENFLEQHPFENGSSTARDEKTAPFPRIPGSIRRELAIYYAMISHIDEQIGRIFEILEKKGQWDNTIVVFAGDNGLALGQHGLLGKQNLYEHSVGIPLVFKGPGIKKGEKSDTLCYLHDVFPTLCELTGTPVPESVESISLVPALKDPEARLRDSQLYAFREIQRAVRKGPWKLILYNVDAVRTTQLFNLDEDPWEKENLADEPGYGELINELTGHMKSLMRECGDPVELDAPRWDPLW